MADVIRLLPDNIANQIAAGEVIQRPASAVKEMMENAIDAGATQVHLIIRDAGKELIQVNDNGKGMSPTDARVSFERHATSKIQSIDDLFAIRTMGFRGEALASIAAVAQVELRTRRAEDEVGTHILIENSLVSKQEPCAYNPGTSLAVKNLFFNVPARRNFLKSAAAETRHIVDEFIRIAMAFPHIAFQFTNNTTTVFQLEASKLKQRIAALLGQQFISKLVPVEEPTDVVSISGFIASPDMATKTRGNQYFFVNKRFIKSAYLNHAVSQAYKDLIAKDEFPVFVLFIEIDPGRIDINVHPTKQEIKFEDERIVYSFVSAAVKHALSKYSLAPSIDFTLNAGIEQLEAITQPFTPQKQEQTRNDYLYKSFSEKGQAHFLEKRSDMAHWKELYKIQHEFVLQGDQESNPEAASSLQLEEIFEQQFIQVAKGYILASTRQGFLLIDQQLAHQRILYEQFENASQQALPIQKVLIPQTFELSPPDAILLEELLPDMLQLGYEIESFGKHTFIIQGIPADVQAGDAEISVARLLEAIKHEQSALKLDKREKLFRSLSMYRARNSGRSLEDDEMRELCSALFACRQPGFSPGGKKIFARFNKDAIQQLIQNA